MNTRTARYRRHRFPLEIISYSVWAFHRFALSFRDVEDLLAERDIVVSYESICELPNGTLAQPTRQQERQMRRFKQRH